MAASLEGVQNLATDDAEAFLRFVGVDQQPTEFPGLPEALKTARAVYEREHDREPTPAELVRWLASGEARADTAS